MKLLPLLLTALFALGAGLQAQDSPRATPQIIILKLDDVVAAGARKGEPVAPRWLRVTEFLEQKKLHASYGIIGWSLEEENALYFDWLKSLHAKGQIELWNHGFRNKRSDAEPREFEQTLEEQKAALQKTQALAREKLGFELKAFGPHWSGVNSFTEAVLDTCPEITSWFALTPNAVSKNPKRFAFERILALENPTFVPDFDKFKTVYERAARQKPHLALQGHPNQWTDERWAGFLKIIEYLQAQGCVFMTPSEFLAQQRPAAL